MGLPADPEELMADGAMINRVSRLTGCGLSSDPLFLGEQAQGLPADPLLFGQDRQGNGGLHQVLDDFVPAPSDYPRSSPSHNRPLSTGPACGLADGILRS